MAGPALAFQTVDQFDRLASTITKTRQLEENRMAQAPQGKNILLDILNNHGDTLQQLSLLAYLSKGAVSYTHLTLPTKA